MRFVDISTQHMLKTHDSAQRKHRGPRCQVLLCCLHEAAHKPPKLEHLAVTMLGFLKARYPSCPVCSSLADNLARFELSRAVLKMERFAAPYGASCLLSRDWQDCIEF